MRGWHVASVFVGLERRFCDDLRTQDGLQVFCPWRRAAVTLRVSAPRLFALYTGFVFVNLDADDAYEWHAVADNGTGFRRFLTGAVIEEARIEEERGRLDEDGAIIENVLDEAKWPNFAVGQRVEIVSGAFSGYCGLYYGMNSRGYAKVGAIEFPGEHNEGGLRRALEALYLPVNQLTTSHNKASGLVRRFQRRYSRLHAVG